MSHTLLFGIPTEPQEQKDILNILRERELVIALKLFVNRYEESGKPQPDTPIHETTLYCAAQAYLNATR